MISFLVVLLSFGLVFYFLIFFQSKINELVVSIRDLKITLEDLDNKIYKNIEK